jgi:hypothetical protein
VLNHRHGGFFTLRGAEMLNIRKKLAVMAITLIMGSHLASPAMALSVTPEPAPAKVAEASLRVSVGLNHMNLTMTRLEAVKALNSPFKDMYDAQALTFLMVYVKGWKLAQWKCLNQLWSKESNFNPLAQNKGSGAYGIAQFMPTTWDNYSVKKTSVPSLQITYGLHYIKSRYGTACSAVKFWKKHYWY